MVISKATYEDLNNKIAAFEKILHGKDDEIKVLQRGLENEISVAQLERLGQHIRDLEKENSWLKGVLEAISINPLNYAKKQEPIERNGLGLKMADTTVEKPNSQEIERLKRQILQPHR